MSIQGSPASRPALAWSLGLVLIATGTAVSFAAQAAGTSEQVMLSFTGGNGQSPQAPLVKVGTSYYGSTLTGGRYGHGAIFRISSTGAARTLHSFTGGADGNGPGPLLLGNDGALYGMAGGAGAFNYGTVFRITTAGGFSKLHDFAAGVEGAFPSPRAGLIQTSDGIFYGTTLAGGASCSLGTGCGTIFSMAPDGTMTVLHQFFGGFDSQAPYVGLTLGPDGNFYGTTNGQSGTGIIYQMKPDGTMTTLQSISVLADTPLLLSTDGTLYGTTLGGGTGNGMLYSLKPDGTLTVLYQFSGGADGGTPAGRLIQGSDGAYYGTTEFGGAAGCGTVFRYAATTGLKTLYSFACAPDAAYPVGGLTQAASNVFLGTSAAGGANDVGTVYRLTLPKR